MKFLEIKSDGLIEVQALSLIGASTKRGDDSTIGQFGSGLKYSIAAIVRQGLPFMVFTGLEEIKVDTIETQLGGRTFNQITINNEPTSLTDSMGTEDWDGAYPFIREIWSNALDADKDSTIEIVNEIVPTAETTTFYIQVNDDIENIMKNFNEYFVTEDNIVLDCGEHGQIIKAGEDTRIYRHGILALQDKNQKSIFRYNLYDVDINESRVVRNIYQAHRLIGTLLESMSDKYLLRQWIQGMRGGNAGKFEHECICSDWTSLVNNPVLVEVILENKYYPIEGSMLLEDQDMKGRLGLPSKLLKRFMKYAPDMDCLIFNERPGSRGGMKRETKPTPPLEKKVAEAVARLMKTEYKHRLDAPIKYYKFSNEHQFGEAIDSKIIGLSVKLVDMSIEHIMLVIVEEQEHIISGYNDETRSFQTHLLRLFTNELNRQATDEQSE